MNVYEEVEYFYRRYSGEKRVIGKSEEGREIFAFFLGTHESPIGISQAAIHGREWVTALLSLELLRRGLRKGGVWVIPLMNPDGALLSEVGISTASPERRRELVSLNGGYDFSLWKANAEGIDLNVNFDANWGTGVKNVFSPASENYVGTAPFSAKESLALKAFTEGVCPDFTVSWHTKGEEIYWSFKVSRFVKRGDRKLAKILSEAVGCPLREAKGSAGGYKDWCQQKLKIPAFTIEAGREELSHPITREELPALKEKYANALRALTEGYHGRKIYERGDSTCRKSQEERGSSHRGSRGVSGEDHRKGV